MKPEQEKEDYLLLLNPNNSPCSKVSCKYINKVLHCLRMAVCRYGNTATVQNKR